MSPSPLNILAAREHELELREMANRSRVADFGDSPVTRVTLRYASAADAEKLRQLAALEHTDTPRGTTLVAEVDGRLRAALPLDGGSAIADRVHRGVEFVELLQLRAQQLAQRFG
jgi:hypothetical protein